ncbi:hypothetical protein NUH16_004087 [Penicillium rubens]|nr:hypothetical protein NUH16_004087 [Penicillium rubens]
MNPLRNGLLSRASTSSSTSTLRRPITPRSQPQVLRQARPQRRYNSDFSAGKTPGDRNATPAHSSHSHHSKTSPPPRLPDTTPATAAAGATTTPVRSRGFREVIKAGPVGKVGRWYARVQEQKPYTTQFWSAIVIYLCGDLSAQMLFPSEVPAPAKSDSGDGVAVQGDGGTVSAGYDPLRTLRHLCVGAGSSIPSYNWFMFLGNHFNYPSKFLSILTKVVVQQTCFTPVFNTYFFGMHPLLAGATLDETWERLKKALPVSIQNSVKLWPAVTAFSFMYVPAQFRNVFSGCIAVGWQTYLSWLNQKAAKEVAAAEALAAAEGMSVGALHAVSGGNMISAGTA